MLRQRPVDGGGGNGLNRSGKKGVKRPPVKGRRVVIAALNGNPIVPTIPLLVAAIILFLLPAGTQEARAQDFDLTVSPVKKELTVQPGERVDFQITLINHTGRDLELLVYPMDFFINPDNSYEFQEPGYYTYSCSRWIELQRDRLTIPPRSQHDEAFSLVVPPDAEPGGHYSVLFFQDAAEPPPGPGGQAHLPHRFAHPGHRAGGDRA